MSLVVKDVFSRYSTSSVDILHDVTVRAEKSRITGIIGPNGAGKSTLLKTIYGFLKPRKGKIYYKGNDITGLKPHVLALSMRIAYIPQERCIFPDLTVYGNLKVYMWTFRKDKEKVEKSIKEIYEIFPILKTKRNNKASSLSGGQQRMLEFSRVVIQQSELILIDEPTAGLAPKIAMEVYQKMERLKEEGRTVLFVDQNVRQAIRLSDYVYILKLGRIVEEGPKEKFEAELKSLIQEWI